MGDVINGRILGDVVEDTDPKFGVKRFSITLTCRSEDLGDVAKWERMYCMDKDHGGDECYT